MSSNFKNLYNDTIKDKLKKELGYSNYMQVPKLIKVNLNMGLGEASADSKIVNHALSDLTLISGQKPVVTYAKKSIAGFKLREKQPIGCKVTLRGDRMFQFVERLVNIALPRVRDFRGLSSKSFDGNGNYSLGIKEQIIFPEINYDKIDKIRGLDITFVTSANDNDSAKKLLSHFYMPFNN